MDHPNWREKEIPTYNQPRTEEHTKNMDRRVSDLSEYLDKAAISRNKRSNSILRSQSGMFKIINF